jgi:CMP-N-acetylneuraminic acid synthetase|tara:strand:- start:576 stop:779 length:204 start_codon:yes stop_codon:yes gene_type:complete
MNKEEKIDKIMELINEKSSSSFKDKKIFEQVLNTLNNNQLNKLVAGIVFAEKPWKNYDKENKIWRLE